MVTYLPWIDNAFMEEVSSFKLWLLVCVHEHIHLSVSFTATEKKKRNPRLIACNGDGFGACTSHKGARSFYGWSCMINSPQKFLALQILHSHLVPFAADTRLSFMCCVIALEPQACGFLLLLPNTNVVSSLALYAIGWWLIFSSLGPVLTRMMRIVFCSLPQFGCCGRIEKVGSLMGVVFLLLKECFIVWVL